MKKLGQSKEIKTKSYVFKSTSKTLDKNMIECLNDVMDYLQELNPSLSDYDKEDIINSIIKNDGHIKLDYSHPSIQYFINNYDGSLLNKYLEVI